MSSLIKFNHFIPLIPHALHKIPKGVAFNLPHVEKWHLHTNVVDLMGNHLMQWENGLALGQEHQRITFKAFVIHEITFLSFCSLALDNIKELSHGEYKILNCYRKTAFLIKWYKRSSPIPTYMVTLILGKRPHFFRLEYETNSLIKYDSESSTYLTMLQGAKIMYSYPFPHKPN